MASKQARKTRQAKEAREAVEVGTETSVLEASENGGGVSLMKGRKGREDRTNLAREKYALFNDRIDLPVV